MGTRKVIMTALSAIGLIRTKPVFGNEQVSYYGDDLPQPKQSLLPEGIRPQNIKLNKAEAKRYRKGRIALRNQARCAGMVC